MIIFMLIQLSEIKGAGRVYDFDKMVSHTMLSQAFPRSSRNSYSKCFRIRFRKNVYVGGDVKNENSSNVFGHQFKVAISNVKHKSGKIIGLAHPVRVPTSTPIYSGKCARGQKFPFLNSASNHIM